MRFLFLLLSFPVFSQSPTAYTLLQLDSLQALHLRQGNYRKGYELALEWQNRVQSQYGMRDTNYYRATHALINFYRELGMYQEMFETAVRMERLIGEHLGTSGNIYYAEAVGDLASAMFFSGKGDEIIHTYRRLVQLRAEAYGTQHPEYARALYNLATALGFIGQFAEAENLYRESLALLEKAQGDDFANIISPLNGLGQVLTRQKRYAEAEALYHRALDIGERLFSKNNRRYNMIVKNLADLYRSTERYAESEEMYSRAMQSILKNNGKTYLYLVSARDLADLYIETGQYEKAERFLYELKDIEQSIDSRHPTRTLTYNYLAKLMLLTGRCDRGLEYCLAGLEVNLETPAAKPLIRLEELLDNDPAFKNPPFALLNLKQLVQILDFKYKNSGDTLWLRSLLRTCQWGNQITERMKNRTEYEADRFGVLETKAYFAAQGIRAAAVLGENQTAFAFAEQNKAASLASALRAQKAFHFGDLPDSLRQKENAIGQSLDRKNKQLLESMDPAERETLRADINELHRQNLQLQQLVQTNYPKYHQLRYQPFSVNMDELRGILNEDMLLVEYALTDSMVYIFCMTNQSRQPHILMQPLNKTLLEQKVRDLRRCLSEYAFLQQEPEKAYRLYTESAHWFYQNFLSKALADYSDKKHLLIIPDGALGHLPFEAFLSQAVIGEKSYADLPYLLRDYSISYSYSGSLLAENYRQVCTLNPKILGFAASYGSDSSANRRSDALSQRRQDLSELPGSHQEVRRLDELFNGAFFYGEQAVEKQFKAQAGDYGILHLAMHGLLDRQNPLLSSLVFSENGDSTEDNFLQAHEISHQSIDALLVVLSACETGYGKFQAGEGVMSLGRAFMYAGVPALVVSLWEVNDVSTTKIMEYFYLNMSRHMDKAQALRQAKLQYMQQAKGNSAHPAFWSAFVQIGDSRPIQLFKKSTIWKFYLTAAGVLLLGIWWTLRRIRRRRTEAA